MSQIVLSAIFGFIFGQAIPYFVKRWENKIHREKIQNAVEAELSQAVVKIQTQTTWLNHDVRKHINPDKETAGKDEQKIPYLSDHWEFAVKRQYWQNSYAQIIEILEQADSIAFMTIHDRIDQYENKVKDLARNFSSNLEGQDDMAGACLNDLIKLNEQIQGWANQTLKTGALTLAGQLAT